MTQFFDLIKTYSREFPGSPGVGLHAFTIKGQGSIPDQGTKISQAMQHGQRAGCVWGGGGGETYSRYYCCVANYHQI